MDERPPHLRLVEAPPKRARKHRKPAAALPAVDAWAVFIRAIAAGATERDAAAIAGTSRDAARTWAHADPKRRAELEAAQAGIRQRALAVVLAAAEAGDWKAAAWFLEKRDREQYGQKVDATVTGTSDETAARLAAAIAAR